MTLFRALLRPLENLTSVEKEDHGIVSSRLAVRAGAKECAKEVVEFVENLRRGALDAFWHSCKIPLLLKSYEILIPLRNPTTQTANTN